LHLAPALFLLGVQKSGTTTAAGRIVKSPDVLLGSDGKELHFFDSHRDFEAKGGAHKYLHQFPLCKEGKTNGKVAFDATPNYFPSTFAPEGIKKMYGDNSDKLKFIVTVNDPMHRLQSAYYHSRDYCYMSKNPWGTRTTSSCEVGQFESWVLKAMDNTTWKKGNGIQKTGEYIPQFQQWFEYFSPSQFIIVPSKYVKDQEGNGEEPFHKYLWNTLGVRAGGELAEKGHGDHLNAHTHKTLETDLTRETMRRANKAYEETSGPNSMGKFLFGLKEKPTLYGCKDCKDEESVAKWLQANW